MAISILGNAKTIYVSSTGDNTDGNSWATAYTTLSAANTAASAGDNIYVKGGTYSFNTTFSVKADVNYYGSFQGVSESETPESRPSSDIDGNGIIESFEFTTPTVLNFTISSNVPGLNFNSNTTLCSFDGFKITGSFSFGTVTTSSVSNCIRLGNNLLFQNNKISNWIISGTINSSTTSNNGTLLLMNGVGSTVNNSLFEDNFSTITGGSSQADVWQSPFIHIVASSASARNVFSNNVLRNNRVTVDFSSTLLTANALTRGLLLSASMFSTTTTYFNAIKNTVIHNNELTYIPNTGSPHQLTNGGIIYIPNGNYTNGDSVIHCTIANNKMSRIGYAIKAMFASTSKPYHIVANNALFNNTNYNGTATAVQNISLSQNPVTTGTSLLVANNIMNGGLSIPSGGGNNGSTVIGNLTDLADTNTGTNAPLFSNPTSFIGYSTDVSINLSGWTIQNGSYLKGKGMTFSNILIDKAGHSFTNPRSVGAYETDLSTTRINLSNEDILKIINKTVTANNCENIEIYNTTGNLLFKSSENQVAYSLCRSGIYIVRLKIGNDIYVQKIQIK